MTKILLIDDERSIRITLAEFLRDEGFEVKTAEDFPHALSCIEKDTWDIVVTDIILPGGSGLQLLHKLHAEQPLCLVLIITGQPSVETAVDAVRDGAYDYLMKPINKESILRAVGRAAQLRRLQLEKKQLEELNRRHQEALESTVETRTRSLAESQTLYQSLVDHIPLFILRKDLAGTYTFANQRFASYVGLPAKAMIGLSDQDIFSENTAKLYAQRVREVLNSGTTQEGCELLQLRGGQTKHFQFIRTPLRSANGTVNGLQCIFWDITEQEAAQSQLRKLARAVEQSPVSIVITDKAGLIEFVNPKFTQVTGYVLNDLVGKSPRVLKSGETSTTEYERLWSTIASGKEWRGELHNKRKDGTLYWETVSISPLRDGNGEITHFIAVKEDTTEKKQLERQFQRAQRLENIGNLASGIAHDLNNILTPIVLCAPLLRGELAQEEKIQLLNTLESSAKRAEGIVKQLLLMGKNREGSLVPVQVGDLIREVEKIARETFPKSIQIKAVCASNLLPILGDATQIHQVLMNLLINARDAMPKEGGEIKIIASNEVLDEHYASMHAESRPGAHVRLVVSDNGSGIPEAIQQHIFDPFFTTKGPEKGTGLGLTNVLGIVKNHHGFILLHSALGKGTSFEINLPATLPADACPTPAPPPHPPPCGNGEWIMVVDDEPAIRHAAKRTLEQAGYNVVLAEDGIDALSQLSNTASPIQLVITDWCMPGMDGPMLCKTLRRLKPEIPVIASTGAAIGESAEEIQRLIEEYGIKVILPKPHTAEILLTSLHTTLHPAK